MKQFQKYGVAAAVATVASGAVAQMMSPNETGDMAIVHYTVNDGKNTGDYIINTTPELRSSRYACVAALILRTLSTSTS